jgi:hypothetical protein
MIERGKGKAEGGKGNAAQAAVGEISAFGIPLSPLLRVTDSRRLFLGHRVE